MNFTKFDITILTVMSLVVIVMSFTFPALGMGGSSVNESDVPEFNMSSSTFDFTGEFPRRPNAADSGVLTFDQQASPPNPNSITGVTLVWIDRPKSDGAAVEIQNTSEYGFDFVLTDFYSSGSELTRQDISPSMVGERQYLTTANWTITYTVTELNNYDEPNMTARVEYNVQGAPDDTKGLSAIPVVGGVTDAVAQFVGWLVTVFFWSSLWIIELVTNILGMIFGVIAYMFHMGYWLADTYSSIVGSAPSWSGVVLAAPGVLLFAEFSKLAVIGIKMLPTT